MCISTLTIRTQSKDWNGYKTVSVPCGKCVKCLKRKQAAWTFRLHQQAKDVTSAAFLTFTYATSPVSKNLIPTLVKKDFQDFMKRLRKSLPTKSHPSYQPLKYYACGEYGTDTHRPHYHAIMFNIPQKYLQTDKIEQIWSHGYVDIKPCNINTIGYTVGYMKKIFTRAPDYIDTETGLILEDDRQPHFSLMSKKMGLNYLTPQVIKYHKERLASYATQSGGNIIALPRYFRDKIFTDKEKSIMNIEATKARDLTYEKLFGDPLKQESYKQENTWKKDQIRKESKQLRLERVKL